MSRVYVKSQRTIDAPPQEVYKVLTDYVVKRPSMLPTNFLDYNVEKGGRGAGTVTSYRLHAGGRERLYRMKVEEPVRGKVITERDSRSSLLSTWTLTPKKGGERTRVQIESEWEGGQGVKGFFEKTFAPLGLKSIYSTMLVRLTDLMPPAQEMRRDKRSEEPDSKNSLGIVALLFGLVMAFGFYMRYFRRQEER